MLVAGYDIPPDFEEREDCQECNGEGIITQITLDPDGIEEDLIEKFTCDKCQGFGHHRIED